MYDQDSLELIRSSPLLAGLDRENLGDLLTRTFSEISAARIRLRNFDSDSQELDDLQDYIEVIRRLANTNQALVSLLPDREDIASAAFVAASAHQLCHNADKLLSQVQAQTYIGAQSISSNIAALLLFMVAESMADSSETSKSLVWNSENPIENALLSSLQELANGNLVALTGRAVPGRESITSEDPATCAVNSLYLTLLEGIHLLAGQILSGEVPKEGQEAASIFQHISNLSAGSNHLVSEQLQKSSSVAFAGPHHLSSLLCVVSKNLFSYAVTGVPSPPNIDPDKWKMSTQRIAKSRPFLWPNHRSAIAQGYLAPGISAAVSFPTGAGKSTLAELKISTALLGEKDVVFLAPTHALVDQTAKSLGRSFPKASVQRVRLDEFGFLADDEELPEIYVMTPEACLTAMSVDASLFSEVGLFVFDECHLLHPSEKSGDRRAIDAMLCVLNFLKNAPEADFLLLSAMMKNTDEIAGWLAELLKKPCLSLTLSWKPTRQLRGSVVYHQDDVTNLQEMLRIAKQNKATKGPPVSVKSELNARPLALFSMKQTWATSNANDYSLVGLLDGKVRLAANKYWKLTPNAIAVSSSIAAASAEGGVKSLVFFQTIKNAASAAKQISSLLEPASIMLNDEEVEWLEIAKIELGSAKHLYLEVENHEAVQSSTVHHGLLLPEERYLCESLYKRPDGIKVLAATSTLAQGMNLPSELVIIGEDSRFDQAQDRRQILKAQELLNAAGRAGRAGENANGIVLVVPGKVVGIDLEESTIGAHWLDLQGIFGQSDQCLDIDDPLTAVLDRIHVNNDEFGEIDKYAIARLASDGDIKPNAESLTSSINGSFSAYLARKRNDSDWIKDRLVSSVTFFEQQSPETVDELHASQVAANLGLSIELVSCLVTSLNGDSPEVDANILVWRKWFFRWLYDNPGFIEQIFRRQNLEEMFGTKVYESFESDADKASVILPIINKLVRRWMKGKPLNELEMVFESDANKLGACVRARRFVIRIIPELSYFFDLPSILHQLKQVDVKNPAPLPAALFQLSQCVKLGFNVHEKAALNQVLRSSHFSRRQIHQKYSAIEPYLGNAPSGEVWDQTLTRVDSAVLEAAMSDKI